MASKFPWPVTATRRVTGSPGPVFLGFTEASILNFPIAPLKFSGRPCLGSGETSIWTGRVSTATWRAFVNMPGGTIPPKFRKKSSKPGGTLPGSCRRASSAAGGISSIPDFAGVIEVWNAKTT